MMRRLARGCGVIPVGMGVLLNLALAALLAAQPDVPPETPPDVPPTPPALPEARYSRPAERELQFQEGVLRYSTGRLAEAEKDFRAILAEDPADTDAWYFLGLTQLDQGRPAEAVESFDQVLRLDPTYDEVRAARARANILLRNFDAAREDLKVLEPDPRWEGLVDYLTGQLLYAEGDLEGAAAAFARARRAGTMEAEPAGFYEGLTYLRMRELVRARSAFRESALVADPTVAAASRQLDSVLREQARALRPWEVQITLSYEYDSNVLQISPDVPTPVGISRESDSRIVLQPRGSYSLIRTPQTEVGIEATGYFAWQFDLTDFDVASYQAGPFLNHRLRDNLYLSARYGYNYIQLGGDEFLQRHIVTPQLTWIHPEFGYTSAYVQYQLRQFAGMPATPELDRDGSLYVAGIVQGISLPELFEGTGKSTLELSYQFGYDDTDGADFESFINTVGARWYVPLPVWKLRGDIGVTVDYERYRNPNSLDAEGRRRRDWEYNIVAGLTREINRNWAMRVDYTYSNNDSNVRTVADQNPFDYDRHQVGVRLIFTY